MNYKYLRTPGLEPAMNSGFVVDSERAGSLFKNEWYMVNVRNGSNKTSQYLFMYGKKLAFTGKSYSYVYSGYRKGKIRWEIIHVTLKNILQYCEKHESIRIKEGKLNE